MKSAMSFLYNRKSHLFIEACRKGDIEQVRQLLPLLTYKQINYTDTNGNTALHIACIQDNYDLVQLLLHSDIGKAFCSRTILNKQRLNAYACAKPENIRRLFARPTSTPNCFIDNNYDVNTFQAKQISNIKSDHDKIDIPNDFNRGYKNLENGTDAQSALAISQAPRLLRKLFKLRTEREACEIVRKLIRRTVKNDTTYKGLIEYFDIFIQTKKADHLLTLYTKEKELCTVFRKENSAFTTLLYLYLNTLAERAFGPGETFRGMAIADSTEYRRVINDYIWANQNDEYVLEIRLLQSTSKDRVAAEFFIEANGPQNQPSSDSGILFHYDFPEKCLTAIDVQGASDFQDEAEVLILPLTLFKVTKIDTVSSDYPIISLTNVPVTKTALLKIPRKSKK